MCVCIYFGTAFPVAFVYIYILRRKVGGYFINRYYVLQARLYCFLTFVRTEIHGLENIKKGNAYIVCGNHTSFADLFAFGASYPLPYKAIGKKEFEKIPIMGQVLSANAILVDRSNKESKQRTLEEMKRAVANGISITIYPEGTRNKTQNPLLPFKDGAFVTAIDTQTNILPMVVVGANKIIPSKGGFSRPGKIKLWYLPEIDIKPFATVEELKQHTYNIIESTLLQKLGN